MFKFSRQIVFQGGGPFDRRVTGDQLPVFHLVVVKIEAANEIHPPFIVLVTSLCSGFQIGLRSNDFIKKAVDLVLRRGQQRPSEGFCSVPTHVPINGNAVFL